MTGASFGSGVGVARVEFVPRRPGAARSGSPGVGSERPSRAVDPHRRRRELAHGFSLTAPIDGKERALGHFDRLGRGVAVDEHPWSDDAGGDQLRAKVHGSRTLPALIRPSAMARRNASTTVVRESA